MSLTLPGDDFPDQNATSDGLLQLQGLRWNLAESMDRCVEALARSGLPAYPDTSDGTLWCNATWDTVLCWPATPAGASISLKCPPLKGLDHTKNITKFCHKSGHWMGRTEDDFTRPYGWTNFTMCFTEQVVDIMKNLNNGSLGLAQDVARTARKLEFVGLGLSLISLTFCIIIFSSFKRLRVFRNMLHLQLMIAILMVVIIRLILYIDLIFTDKLDHLHGDPEGRTINTMEYVCELMFFLLEYFKSVAFWWMFLEGFCLHNQLVLKVFNADPRIEPYLFVGYGVPLVHTLIWLAVVLYKKEGKVERCLGSYYLETEFWILDGPRLAQLTVNTIFVCNVIRVLWTKVKGSHSSGEMDRMKKSVKAAFMLIPLLGIPNIMQTIPFSPTQENITYFAIWTYCASFTYMYQGLIISIIYCFTNREVQAALRMCYNRYQLQHKTAGDLRRGSKPTALSHFVTSYNANGHGGLDRNANRKESESSPSMKLLLPSTTVSSCACTARRNMSTVSEPLGSIYSASCSTCTEQTPLRTVNRDKDDDDEYDELCERPAVVRIHEFA
ncbi:pigment dispersing factor receptor c [Aphelenchoides avenae]|nr:pigment dispersing factor receptor c [Aphelenchus avenae]